MDLPMKSIHDQKLLDKDGNSALASFGWVSDLTQREQALAPPLLTTPQKLLNSRKEYKGEVQLIFVQQKEGYWLKSPHLDPPL